MPDRPIIGAWCTRPSRSDVDFAADIGLRRLDVMVNDFSIARGPTKFRFDKLSKDVVEYAASRGIAVHITSWIMPHVEFAREAGDELQHLCGVTGAQGVVLDAEEPWTLAHQANREAAADAFFDAMMGCRCGVTGIGFADRAKLGPLMARADYGVPQAYVTRTSGLSIAGIKRVLQHWEAFGKPITPALAGYRVTDENMTDAWAAVQPAQTVLYWALRHIKMIDSVERMIRRFARG